MKLPLIRVGLTLAVGSIVASAVRFYVAMGAAAADLDSTIPTTPRAIQDWFVKDFLFQGSIPELLFWVGVAIAVLGMVRLALVPSIARRRAVDPNAAIAAAIADFHAQPPAAPPPPRQSADDPGPEKW